MYSCVLYHVFPTNLSERHCFSLLKFHSSRNPKILHHVSSLSYWAAFPPTTEVSVSLKSENLRSTPKKRSKIHHQPDIRGNSQLADRSRVCNGESRGGQSASKMAEHPLSVDQRAIWVISPPLTPLAERGRAPKYHFTPALPRARLYHCRDIFSRGPLLSDMNGNFLFSFPVGLRFRLPNRLREV